MSLFKVLSASSIASALASLAATSHPVSVASATTSGQAVNKEQLDARALTVSGVAVTSNLPSSGQSFVPTQWLWGLHLTCSGGTAIVTLSGVRRDTGATETVATYSMTAGSSAWDTLDKQDYVSFSWASSGAGTVVVEIS